jgi:uncharacterized protein YdeI (YjbR/CyaY-like superfamily)
MLAMGTYLPAVDVYISQAQPFAQPVLTHLRDAIHRAVPGVEEEIKWSRPFFVYKGIILGNISAFKEHCSLGLWGGEMAGKLRADGIDSSDAMGSFGKLRTVDDLPPRKKLEAYLREAAKLIDEGARTKSLQRVAKPSREELELPPALKVALAKNTSAAKRFAGMSPSCRREYSEWIADAKRDETRDRRVMQAVAWIAEGKHRHWKYGA